MHLPPSSLVSCDKRLRIIRAAQFGRCPTPLVPFCLLAFLPSPPPSASLRSSPRYFIISSSLFFLLDRTALSLFLSFTLYIELNGIVMRRPRLQFPLYRLVLLLFPRLFVHLSLPVSLTLVSVPLFPLSLFDYDRATAKERLYSDVHIRGCDSVRHREQARASARTHTEQRNLSLTRILNGCAEARTVGTHYSTHPPPLRQNSTPSSRSCFPPCSSVPSASTSPLVPRAAPSPFREFFLAAVFLSLYRIPGPLSPHPSTTASSRSDYLRSPSLPLLSFSLRALVCTLYAHVKLLLCVCFYLYVCACTCVQGTHVQHPLFIPPFVLSFSLAVYFGLFLLRFSVRHNPRT